MITGAFPIGVRLPSCKTRARSRSKYSGLRPARVTGCNSATMSAISAAGSLDLSVRFDGAEVASIAQIPPVGAGGYSSRNVMLPPAHADALLEFVTTANGDATLLLDAVSIVRRDAGNVVIENPSFEATGVPSGVGYIQPDKFAGWDSGSGGWGPNITGVGPFTDNGAGPDQDMVAFLQGNGCFISQNVTGLTPNEKYTL